MGCAERIGPSPPMVCVTQVRRGGLVSYGDSILVPIHHQIMEWFYRLLSPRLVASSPGQHGTEMSEHEGRVVQMGHAVAVNAQGHRVLRSRFDAFSNLGHESTIRIRGYSELDYFPGIEPRRS
jgi:hypothetical protein